MTQRAITRVILETEKPGKMCVRRMEQSNWTLLVLEIVPSQPRLISKGEKQLNGFDERIISLYSRGLSVRDMQAHFQEVYGIEVSMTFISQVTNAVMEDVKAWQQHPLDLLYLIVYFDCIVIKSQESGAVINKSVSLALGINTLG